MEVRLGKEQVVNTGVFIVGGREEGVVFVFWMEGSPRVVQGKFL